MILFMGFLSIFSALGIVIGLFFLFFKRTRKKGIWVLPISLLLSICGFTYMAQSDDSPTEKKSITSSTSQLDGQDEISTEEKHQQIRKEAQDADFVEINVDNPPDKIVRIEGKVSAIENAEAGGKFIISSKEKNGYGIYNVFALFPTNFKENQTIILYGSVQKEKAENGGPLITGLFYDKAK
ncbi:OB-fold putative lipoprotein [Bacillus spizizenii]|nr:OB-fold putative lipoprotein [Bacillus spizizenii]MCY8167693.1 OB-fold putative lipoprotein [Bacillus spizizenii]MCY9234486.1 OB-fold putative lipoprotein [Bacillus spizizenii]MCY9254484.1 OB-fold putative lipoprotein [Bacillus spizizenii]MCY9294968.1 OB-fold putative lipoprotein [Bacillus spizizenii]